MKELVQVSSIKNGDTVFTAKLPDHPRDVKSVEFFEDGSVSLLFKNGHSECFSAGAKVLKEL